MVSVSQPRRFRVRPAAVRRALPGSLGQPHRWRRLLGERAAASADDGAVPLRPHHRHDVPAGVGRVGSGDRARQPFRRAHAGGHRLPSVLPVARFAARPVEGPPGGARAPGTERRADSHGRAQAGGVRRPASVARRGARRCVWRVGAWAGWARAVLGGGGKAADHGDLRAQVPGGGGLCAAGARDRLLRADGSSHQRLQPGACGSVSGAAEHPAGRAVERELLDPAVRVLSYAEGFQSVAPQRGQLFQWGSPMAPHPPQRTDLTTAFSGRAPRESSFQTATAPMAITAAVSQNQPAARHIRTATRTAQMACHCFRLRREAAIPLQ
ncbi:hypothetical protein SBA4_2900014 [Candidatus Sulfopaludibacter sp. SbA4]|nr:hypothetical protein SBA4_2900014 [Candidatus Sulfopaludibacter sp. SbA4]